jgi:hypothetical protein
LKQQTNVYAKESISNTDYTKRKNTPLNCESHNATDARAMDTERMNAKEKNPVENAANHTPPRRAQRKTTNAANAEQTTQHGIQNAPIENKKPADSRK